MTGGFSRNKLRRISYSKTHLHLAPLNAASISTWESQGNETWTCMLGGAPTNLPKMITFCWSISTKNPVSCTIFPLLWDGWMEISICFVPFFCTQKTSLHNIQPHLWQWRKRIKALWSLNRSPPSVNMVQDSNPTLPNSRYHYITKHVVLDPRCLAGPGEGFMTCVVNPDLNLHWSLWIFVFTILPASMELGVKDHVPWRNLLASIFRSSSTIAFTALLLLALPDVVVVVAVAVGNATSWETSRQVSWGIWRSWATHATRNNRSGSVLNCLDKHITTGFPQM